MNSTILKNLTILAPSIVLLTVAYLAVPYLATLPPLQHELALLSPYLFVAAGMTLSFAFGRGRVFFMLLLVALFYWCFRSYLTHGLQDFVPQVVFQCLCLFIPLNMTIFSFVRERGVLTLSGRMRLTFLALQLAVVVWIIRYRQDYSDIPQFFAWKFLHIPFLSGMVVPQPAWLIAIIGIILILLRVIIRKSPIESGLLGSLVALFIAMNTITSPDFPTVFTASAALILAVSVLQDTYNMAFQDDLTKLPSRRALNELLLSLGRQYAIAMLDVDHFKSFNDTHGHEVGDQVLKLVAKKMAAVKGGGKAFRYGGEEFTIVFRGKKAAYAAPFLEDVRRAIADYDVVIRGEDRPKSKADGKKRRSTGTGDKTVSVTISIGLAESSDTLRSPVDVLKAADKALYRAKNKGRNQLSR